MISSPSSQSGVAWLEGVAVGLGGALFGALSLAWSDWWVAGAVVGGANGLISGSMRTYQWRDGSGRLAFFLDSTWGLLGTTVGLLTHGVNLLWPNAGYLSEVSERSGLHVYRRGLVFRPGFIVTLGNVVSGASYRLDESDPVRVARRRQLIERHEGWHAWQSRRWGPLFQIGYGAWLVFGVVVGTIVAVATRRPLFKTVETMAYYNNPFEVAAYRRDENWPPRGGVPELLWGRKRPIRPE